VNNAPNALRLGLGEYNCMSINNELKIAPKDFVDIPLGIYFFVAQLFVFGAEYFFLA